MDFSTLFSWFNAILFLHGRPMSRDPTSDVEDGEEDPTIYGSNDDGSYCAPSGGGGGMMIRWGKQ